MAAAQYSVEDPETVQLDNFEEPSPKVCGVWINEDNESGVKIFGHLDQPVARVDHEKLPFPWDWSDYGRYFALLSKKSLKDEAFMLCLTEDLYKLYHMNDISDLVLIIIDQMNDKEKLPEKLANFTRIKTISFFWKCTHGLDEIKEKLTEPSPKRSVGLSEVPVGDVGPGLAWSYFYGYLNLILPDIRNRIETSATCREYGNKMSKQFIIVIPDSCNIPAKFEDDEQRFTIIKELEGEIPKARAGHTARSYRIDIHKVEDKNDQDYYFCGGFPNSVSTLRVMNEEKLLDDKEMKRQRDSFKDTLTSILEHHNECNGKAHILSYNDTKGRSSLAGELCTLISNP